MQQKKAQGNAQHGHLSFHEKGFRQMDNGDRLFITFTSVLSTYQGHIHNIFQHPHLALAQRVVIATDQGAHTASTLCCGLKPGRTEGIPRVQDPTRVSPLQFLLCQIFSKLSKRSSTIE